MAEARLTVKVISPEQTVFEGAAEAVFLPGSAGPFEVLPGHAPLISSLTCGDIGIREPGGQMRLIHVREGVARVLRNNITVCVD